MSLWVDLSHLFLTCSPPPCSKKDVSVKFTHEQLRICSYDVQPRDVVKIVAFAGTGKTTTLERYTQLRPGRRFLLVVYNK